VAGSVVAAMVADLPTEPVVVNLNVPNVALDQVKGWRRTVVGTQPPRAMASAVLEPKHGHDGTFHVRMGWGEPVALPIETDGGAVEQDEVSITFLGRLMEETTSAALPQAEAALAALLDR
jgi:5'-nucleotidase